MTDQASITAAAERIGKEFGRLDLLINNAAISNTGLRPGMTIAEYAKSTRPSNVSLDEVRAVWETNVFGVLAVYQAMLPLLRKAPAARIVNVSSGVGSLTMNSDAACPYRSIFGPVYPASKTALNAMTLAMAIELESTGIKVNAVSPGFTKTNLNNYQGTETVAEGAARGGARCAARPGRPDWYVLAREARTAPVVIGKGQAFRSAHPLLLCLLSSRTLNFDPKTLGHAQPLFWRPRVEDIKRIRDQLDVIEASAPELSGRLDRSRVAVVGHSMGGRTSPGLRGSLGPLPKTVPHLSREPMSELAHDEHDLAPMMALMGDEIGQHMAHVKRQVAPCIRRRRRNLSVPLEPQGQQAGDPAAAALQGADQLRAGHPVPVNRWRHRNTVRLPESLYPHAARIVDMASEHPNRAPRRTRDSSVPQCSGELLDQEGCDAVGRRPSRQNAVMKWRSPRLHGSAPNVLTPNDLAPRPVVVQLSRLLVRDRPFPSSARQAASQQVSGAMDALSISVQNVGVDHNGSNVVVAQQPLILIIDGEGVKQSLAQSVRHCRRAVQPGRARNRQGSATSWLMSDSHGRGW